MAAANREIRDTAEFYAHALAIEREAAARYWEFAHQLLLYRKNAAALVFLQLARMESEHLDDLERRTAGMNLPRPFRTECRWQGLNDLQAEVLPVAHCLMNPREALEIALVNERRARAFYERIAHSAHDLEIRRLAAERASEEAGHIAYVERALSKADSAQGEARVAERSARQAQAESRRRATPGRRALSR